MLRAIQRIVFVNYSRKISKRFHASNRIFEFTFRWKPRNFNAITEQSAVFAWPPWRLSDCRQSFVSKIRLLTLIDVSKQTGNRSVYTDPTCPTGHFYSYAIRTWTAAGTRVRVHSGPLHNSLGFRVIVAGRFVG